MVAKKKNSNFFFFLSGLQTGSVYFDRLLNRHAGFAEGMKGGSVLVTKTHAFEKEAMKGRGGGIEVTVGGRFASFFFVCVCVSQPMSLACL